MSPLHPVQALFGAFERNKTETLGQNIIGNDGGVIVDVGFLNGKCRDFGKEDAAECVGDGCVQANKREGGFEWFIVVEFNSKVLEMVNTVKKRFGGNTLFGICLKTIHCLRQDSVLGSLWM